MPETDSASVKWSMWTIPVRTPLGSTCRLEIEAADRMMASRIAAEYFRRCGWRIRSEEQDEILLSWQK